MVPSSQLHKPSATGGDFNLGTWGKHPRSLLTYMYCFLPESAMERDRYMSPMEAQEFGILDKVLVHPPQDGEDEPELVQKETPTAPADSPAPAST